MKLPKIDIKSPEAKVFIVIVVTTIVVNLLYDFPFTGVRKIA